MESHRPDVPSYFRDVIRACLSDAPRNRPSATDLLKKFPDPHRMTEVKPRVISRESVSTHRSDKVYIDPATAVNLDDISQHRRHSREQSSFENILVPVTEYPTSSGSYIIPNSVERGRSPDDTRSKSRYRRSECSPYPGRRSVLSLDDSEMENELASLPASRETRWEQIYVDGDTKLVQRGCGEIGVHDFAQEPKEICITTPPGEMENSFMTSKPPEDTPINFSSFLPIEPQVAQSSLQEPFDESRRGMGTKASFSDRVHQLAQAQSQNNSPNVSPGRNRPSPIPDSTILADLEQEVDFSSSVSTSTAPSRVGTGFSIFDLPDRPRRVGTGFSIAQGHRRPLHQDSGFDEPERMLYEGEIRRSLDESIRDLKTSRHEEDLINECLWDDKNGPLFGKGVRGEQLQGKPPPPMLPTISLPLPSVGSTNVLSMDVVKNKPLEEKVSNTTIRPSGILLPAFQDQHSIPKALETIHHNPTPATDLSTSIASLTYTSTYQHSYLDPTNSRPSSRAESSSDLDDYLSHSISFDHSGDF
jgi:hypothetical protein